MRVFVRCDDQDEPAVGQIVRRLERLRPGVGIYFAPLRNRVGAYWINMLGEGLPAQQVRTFRHVRPVDATVERVPPQEAVVAAMAKPSSAAPDVAQVADRGIVAAVLNVHSKLQGEDGSDAGPGGGNAR